MLTNHLDFMYEIPDTDLAIYNRVLPAEDPLLDALEMIHWEEFRKDLEKRYLPNRGQPALERKVFRTSSTESSRSPVAKG